MTEEKQKPLTRKDVLKLIEQNGGTAERLDLSGAVFEAGIDLSGLNLQRVILKEAKFPTSFKREIVEGADLRGTHLENADLTKAHLERAELHETHLERANLRDAHLEGAYIWDTHLEGANLMMAHLQGANLTRTKFSPNINLQDVDWGNYILDEDKQGDFESAVASYRHLKMWYTNAGYSDIAAKFYYREKEVQRKRVSREVTAQFRSVKIWTLFRRQRTLTWSFLWLWIYWLLCGYGEKTFRVAVSAAIIILGLAVAYYFWGSFNTSSFWDTLYYSAVSFTALGYGKWAPQPTGWAKGMGAVEAFIGVFTIALFLVTFVRKMTR